MVQPAEVGNSARAAAKLVGGILAPGGTLNRLSSEAEVYSKTTRADAHATYEELIADGGLAIAKAEALRNELRNEALDTKGGRIYLARQAAENLQFEHVTLNSPDGE